MAADDDDGKPPVLKLVSENPNAHVDRTIEHAKVETQRALSHFAASLLRVMAGSNSETIYLIRRLSFFIDAQKALYAASGEILTPAELEEALRLPQYADSSRTDNWSERRRIREDGLESIVQGALRLAAHHLLDEQPAFGGMHSERVIMDGIKTLEELKRPLPPEPKSKGPAHSWKDTDLSPSQIKPTTKRTQQREFSKQDLRELRNAIKAKDEKKIAELTAKIGRPFSPE